MKKTSIVLFSIVLCVFAISGCSMKKMATNVIGKISADGIKVIESEEDVELARVSSPPLLKTLEVLREGNPKDFNLLMVLSEGYGQYTFGFLEETLLSAKPESKEYLEAKARADMFYRRGREYGIAALSERGMAKAFKSPVQDFKKAVAKLGKKDARALFWTAFNWANYLNMHLDDPAAIVDLPRIEAMIDRVIEIDPSFNYGSALAFKGVLLSMRPKMLGGNPELANEVFKKAIKSFPDYLMTKVLYAQYFARQTQDVGLFKYTLDDVIAADATKLYQERLPNELAKRRAKILLDSIKKFF